jgi:hypothetical protein
MLRDQERRARGNDKWPRLPAKPLAEFIAVRKAQSTESDEALCARYGTTSRTYTRWRTGDAKTTPFEVADRLLQLAGVAWSDVYDECGACLAAGFVGPVCERCDTHLTAKGLFEPGDPEYDDCSDLDFFPGARGVAA